MKRLILITLTAIAFGSASYSQVMEADSSKCTLSIGTEIDLLPFATGGYYGSVVVGYKNFRLRPIYSKANQPEFVLPEGFDKNKMDVYAILFDYFFNNGKTKKDWWVGVGFEYWKNNAHNKDDKSEKTFSTQIFTVGGGYVWHLTENIYINPWCAGHLTIGGDTNVKIGSRNYKSKIFLPEVSLKLGIAF
jgi:hypothetical protein